MASKVAIIGGGTWGVGLAAAAARAGNEALLYARRELDVPKGVTRTTSLEAVAAHARLIVLAVPSGVVENVLVELGDHLDGGHYVVHGVRGLTGDALDTVSDVVRRATPVKRVGATGGPVLASDLLAGRPSVIVVGSRYPEVNEVFTTAFGSPSLRVYPTLDLRGLEWASVLVGCMAIGVGYAQGKGLSPGLIAAFIARAMNEASRVAAAAGGDAKTLLGLAGYGDLLASTSQSERPEVVLGRALARGETLDHVKGEIGQRIEAVELLPRVIAFAATHQVKAPILDAIEGGLLSGRPGEEVVDLLMKLPIQLGA